MNTFRAALCLYTLLIFGCGEPKFAEKVKDPEVQGQAQSLAWQAFPLDQPNQYRVVIALPSTDHRPLVVVKSEINQSVTETTVEASKDRDGNFIDEDVDGGAEYFYRFFEKSTGRPVFESQVRIPHDKVISGTHQMTAPNSLQIGDGRVFFTHGATLVTGAHDLVIEAAEIVSEDAKIISYSSEGTAPSGANGSGAASIRLIAKKVTGHLKIVNRGQKGGKGSKGLTGKKGPRGGSGGETHFSTTGGARGPNVGPFCAYDGDSVFGWRFRGLPSREKWLKDHPGRGKRGEQGLEGYSGFPGLTGGAGGDVQIDLPKSELPKISVDASGGTGGDGGDGGDGGEGGDGGPGGTIHGNHACDRGSSQCCRDAPEGPIGATGPVGPEGPRGQQGAPGKIIVNGEVHSNEVFP
jgi:hypothetical protein